MAWAVAWRGVAPVVRWYRNRYHRVVVAVPVTGSGTDRGRCVVVVVVRYTVQRH